MDAGVILFGMAILAVVVGVFTSYVAESKGYSSGGWFVLGFFFNLIALIAAAGLAPREKKP